MQREDLSRNFGFILHDVARLLRATYDRRMKALGLTRSQWWVLTHLYRNDGVTQTELADMLEIEKPTLGRLLDRLESNGWIRREEHTDDRRAKRVFLTDEVEPAMKAMREAAAELRRDALAGLSREQQTKFVDTLLAVKANLGGGENGSARSGSSRNSPSQDGSARDESKAGGSGRSGSVRNGPTRNGVRAKGYT
ncbi:MAG: MarR family transcriptional regulator [Betaproteobacteria bacterium]|nr:MAG: MarR family transcriptional regulator [Betaproteobacteria bacterium]